MGGLDNWLNCIPDRILGRKKKGQSINDLCIGSKAIPKEFRDGSPERVKARNFPE
jgi:hypothetical protein